MTCHWLICKWQVTHPFTSDMSLMYKWHVTHLQVTCHSFTDDIWDMTHAYVVWLFDTWHDCVTRLTHIVMCDVTHSDVACLINMWYYGVSVRCMRFNIAQEMYATGLIEMWHVIDMWHDVFACDMNSPDVTFEWGKVHEWMSKQIASCWAGSLTNHILCVRACVYVCVHVCVVV